MKKSLPSKCNNARKISLDTATLHKYHKVEMMDEREYQALKEHIEAEYREASAALEDDYKRKLAALELTWSVAQGRCKKRGLAELNSSKPIIGDLIRSVLPSLGTEFTKYDIERAVEKKFPEAKGTFRASSLAGTVSRMVKRKQLEVVRRGSGPEGFTYRRAAE